MRVGLIADIHGNLVALDAVLADLEQVQVDQRRLPGRTWPGALSPARRSSASVP